jgi:hypothetical protein
MEGLFGWLVITLICYTEFQIEVMDALHIACAEAMDCDYFLSCDDRLLKRYKDHLLEIKNPVEFIFLLTGKNDESENA